MNELWPWLTLAALGAYHGINPGMGWLFAVALGLQEKSRAAVVRAFAPIGLGHAIAIAAFVGLVAAVQSVMNVQILRLAGAGVLVAFGLYKLIVPMSHPRWVGMRVNFRDLTVWSFLMATAHGAGLMLVPVLLQLQVATTTQVDHVDHSTHAEHMLMTSGATMPTAEVAAVVIHTAAMFLVMGLIAVIVYEKLGLTVLRRAWFNLDRLWAVALIGAGVLACVAGIF